MRNIVILLLGIVILLASAQRVSAETAGDRASILARTFMSPF